MASGKFIRSIMKNLRLKNIAATVKDIHSQTGRAKAALFADIFWCGIRYGAGHRDYALFEMYELSGRERDTYVTRGRNNKIVSRLNNPDYFKIVNDKNLFNKRFEKYLKRRTLDLGGAGIDDFREFIKGQDKIVAKPSRGTCGKGIELLRPADFSSAEELLAHIRSRGLDECEEYVVQHEAMARLYAGSVNTVRIVTINAGGRVGFACAFVRIGNAGRFVDNINSGGMAAPVDLDTGVVTRPGYDKDGVTYECHPETGEPIIGFAVPMWEAARAMCAEAALKIPEVGYIGWDVCVTADGPLLLEGNPYPGHDILQLPAHIYKGKGLWPRYKKLAGLR